MEQIINWKIAGPAGYGIKVSGQIFSNALNKLGFYTFDYPEYPSLVRGGHNSYHISFSNKKVYSCWKRIDLLVALNDDSYEYHKKELNPSSVIISKDNLDFDMIAKNLGNQMLRNSVCLGASFKILGFDLEALKYSINEFFNKKGEEVVRLNIKAIEKGYENLKCKKNFKLKLQEKSFNKEYINISGNEAVVKAAIKAKMKVYTAYPMTPASSILHYLSEFKKEDLIVRQTEDEISAINMAIGASLAGSRVMVGTSGGGFSLMVEALGLSAMLETPLVIIEVQRPGPSTGLPTWTSQADLKFVINAAQDEFPLVVITPGDIEEAFYLTFQAFNLADKYQIPVIILSDKFLGESRKLSKLDFANLKIERGKIIEKEMKLEDFKRYDTKFEDGVSYKPNFGLKGFEYIANSYEHNEYGISSEDEENRRKMVEKRFKKIDYIKKEINPCKFYGPKNAKITLICFGSTKASLISSLEVLNKNKPIANVLHFFYTWPLDEIKIKEIFKKVNYPIIVECNKSAQFASILKEVLSINIKEKILKYTGRPIFPEEIIDYINTINI